MKILKEFQIHDFTNTSFNEDQKIQIKEYFYDVNSIESQNPADNERRSQESVTMIEESDDISQESEHRGKEMKEFNVEQQGELKELKIEQQGDQELQKDENLVNLKFIESPNPADNELQSHQESVMMIYESDDISHESRHRGNKMKELKIKGQGEITPEERSQSYNLTSGKTPCTKCGILVKHLKQHLMWKHNPNCKKFYCPECSYVSLNATNVKLHRRVHNVDMDNRREFSCDQCGKFFTKMQHLNIHIRRVHENKKDTCSICQKQFSSGLLRHLEIDHEGKRFPCEYCDHQSTQKSSLKMHIEAKHKGIKHTCNQCGKSFSQSGTLNIHIKTKH